MSAQHPDLSNFTVEDLHDPTVEAHTLQELAATRPDLWPAILNHPNTYPDLAMYIHQKCTNKHRRHQADSHTCHRDMAHTRRTRTTAVTRCIRASHRWTRERKRPGASSCPLPHSFSGFFRRWSFG